MYIVEEIWKSKNDNFDIQPTIAYISNSESNQIYSLLQII